MMSKKALEELKNNFDLGTIGKALCDIISQDIERLEKYKKAIKIFTNYINICKPFDLDTFLNSYYDNEDICLIKEMLKNG